MQLWKSFGQKILYNARARDDEGTWHVLQEIHPQTFDKWMQENKPKLRKELMSKKITKKFYVGSRSMIDGSRNDWAHTTINAAIEHARQLCDETEEDQIVVQIVRVVRKQNRPTIVEKV